MNAHTRSGAALRGEEESWIWPESAHMVAEDCTYPSRRMSPFYCAKYQLESTYDAGHPTVPDLSVLG